MKNAKILLYVLLLMHLSCNNDSNTNNAVRGQKTTNQTDNTSIQTATNESSNAGKQNDGIAGEWELILLATDDIRNGKLDEEERRNAFTQAENKDYLKLNSDGSALFTQIKIKGRYELQTESNGKKKLVMYDRDNNDENRGIVYSVSRDELILFKAGSTFSIYKRLNN